MSIASRDELLGSGSIIYMAAGESSAITRLERMVVYYAGDNWVLVKKAPPRKNGSNNIVEEEAKTILKDSVMYEIDRGAINSITWFDEDATLCRGP